MIRILLTSMGGGGSNGVLKGLRSSSLGNQIYCVGTHADKYELACSTADRDYLVPYAREEEAYVEAHLKIERNEKIDLFIPNSDKEVLVVARNRRRFQSRLFLPDEPVIAAVQDKFLLFKMLKKHGVPVAETLDLSELEDIEKSIQRLPCHEGKFWVRVKSGAGSVAATWVQSPRQALYWIKLWQELHGLALSQFVVSEFLPGKDYAVQGIWQKGKLVNVKSCQRLTYYDGDQRLSGMASTPGVALTVDNRRAVENCIQAVETVSREFDSLPHGVYELDMRENSRGEPCVTEINIGRFPMINPIFNVSGKQIPAELYVRIGMGMEVPVPDDPYDCEAGILMLRAVDRPLTFRRLEEIEKVKIGAPFQSEADLAKVESGGS